MTDIDDIPKCDDADECSLEREEKVGTIAHRYEQPLDRRTCDGKEIGRRRRSCVGWSSKRIGFRRWR